jgi:adenylate cyclase
MRELRNAGLGDAADGIAESLDLRELDAEEEHLPHWLSQRRLFWAPESLPRDQLKLFTSRLVTIIAGGSVHVALAAFFLAMSQPWLAALNVGSIAWFVVAAVLTRRGHHRLGVLMGFAEVVVHVPVMTLLVGLDGGYLAYNLAIGIVAMVLFPASERRTRIVLVAIALVSGGLLAAVGMSSTPVIVFGSVQVLGYLNVGGTVLALFFIMGTVAAAGDRAEARLERERRRSEKLLLNILPSPIAERLKRDPGTIADAFQSVTVLFADVVGFTKLSATMESTQVVEILNEVFSEFDRLAAKHRLEKIKTIGDGYMVVGGLPEPHESHAVASAQMAIDMHEAIRAYSERTGHTLEIRVGLHSGPVVAGVIGVNKFAYDIWGDTVNTASRMESLGAAGRTQVSDATKELLSDSHTLDERGLIEVKGKGKMHTWYLTARR